jgi:LPXTG-motif cell wall-anchored protein
MPVNWDKVLSKATETAITTGTTLVTQGAQAGNYPECGTRPFFRGKKRQEYDACVVNAEATRQGIKQDNNGGENNTLLYVGIGVVALIGGYLILKRK